MNESKLEIKLAFIIGLRNIVSDEISRYADLHIIKKETDLFYLDFLQDLTTVKHLRSVARAYVIVQNSKYNPSYISNHKSILGGLIDIVIRNESNDAFKTFKISCAGSESKEVRGIAEYIQRTYGLVEKEDADIKIHIVKYDEIWEVGVQITPRPMSLRDYKLMNMSGAMDPTIAFAVNSLCGLDKANSYLNIFSGSATLLIEAAQCYPNIERFVGFDNDKKRISLAIQNIKKAGLMKRIQLKQKDIFDKPDLGKSDAITSDLPFGMAISKNEDLNNLYQYFVDYCQETLNKDGNLVIYTSEHQVLERIILNSKFKIIETLDLNFITSVNSYLRPKIFVCGFK